MSFRANVFPILNGQQRSWSKWWMLVAGFGVVTAVVGYIVVQTLGRYVVTSAYNGESFTALNNFVNHYRHWGPEERSLDYMLNKISTILYRGIGMAVICQTWCLMVWRLRREFFAASAHPMTISILRMSVFWLIALRVNPQALGQWGEFPEAMLRPPVGTKWFVQLVPLSATWLVPAGYLCVIAAWFAVFGIGTRYSTKIAACLTLICLGVPNLFGKVVHYHEMAWFAILLSLSPCGDALSVDATWRAWRRGRAGLPPEHIQPHNRYHLPLTFVMLLLGVVYLFPGMWKYGHSGLDWAFSDNLKLMLYQKWVALEGWTPIFRLDQYPWAYKLSGLLTLVLEVVFIFLILFRWGRPLAAVGGYCFHISTMLFMAITSHVPFYYVCLFECDRILKACGRFIGLRELHCTLSTNSGTRLLAFVGLAKSLDLLSCLRFEDSSDAVKGGTQSLRVVCVGSGREIADPGEAIRLVVRQVPLLWPMLVIPGAINRVAADEAQQRWHAPVERVGHEGWQTRLLVITGVSLFVINSVFGVLRIEKAWPFTCYPTFSFMATAQRRVLSIDATLADGSLRTINRIELREAMGMKTVRFDEMVNAAFLKSGESQLDQFRQMWKKAVSGRKEYSEMVTVAFYREIHSVIPEEWDDNPVKRELLFNYPVVP